MYRNIHQGSRWCSCLQRRVLKKWKICFVIWKGEAKIMIQTSNFQIFSGFTGEVVGVVHQQVFDSLYWSRVNRETRQLRPGHLQPLRGLRDVPRRGQHLPLRLGCSQCQQEEPLVPGSQWSSQMVGSQSYSSSFPLLFRRLQSKILVQKNLELCSALFTTCRLIPGHKVSLSN